MNKQILIDIIDLVRKAVEDGTTVFPLCDYLAETFDLNVSAERITTDYRNIQGSDNVVRKLLSVLINIDQKNNFCLDARHEDGNLIYIVFNFKLECYRVYLKINIRDTLFLDQTITYNYAYKKAGLKDSMLLEFRDFLTNSPYCLSFIDYTTPFDVLHAAVAAEYDAVRLSDGLYYLSSFNLGQRVGELMWSLVYRPPILKEPQSVEFLFKDCKVE
jgi:hypothetical protein